MMYGEKTEINHHPTVPVTSILEMSIDFTSQEDGPKKALALALRYWPDLTSSGIKIEQTSPASLDSTRISSMTGEIISATWSADFKAIRA